MTSRIFVRRLNTKHIYISEPFNIGTEENRVIVCPIDNEIKYTKTDGGYIVSGEGYIVDNDNDKISTTKKRLGTFKNVKYTEGKTEDELF